MKQHFIIRFVNACKKKLNYFSAFLVIVLPLIFSTQHSYTADAAPPALNSTKQNIALGKKYTCSPLPNYKFIKGEARNNPDDAVLLTDGKVSDIPDMHKDNKTAGWDGKAEVIIDFNLDKIYEFKYADISTCGNSSSGVRFPKEISILISLDKINYQIAGVLAEKDIDEIIGKKIEKRKLRVSTPGAVALFVRFI
ncbi:MAG TPA: hypothetical protein DC049_06705, partial [Spirochaetia bacterium]|nr:hypothetical protein [Spirochaetia bacterium]